MRRPVNASSLRIPAGPGVTALARAGIVCALAAALLGAGCGYRLDSPRLPDNAGTLAIGVIRNQTGTGELDIRLQQLLRSRMLRHATLNLAPIESSEMSLEILLADLKITRARSLTSTNVSSIVYELRGEVSLLDRRRATYVFYRQPATAAFRLDFDAPLTETPAVRDRGIDGVLDGFANRVETLVLLSF